MKNFVQSGENVSLPAPYAVAAGGGALIGSLFGIAVTDVASGATGAFKTCGVFTLPKVSAQAWGQGALIYWDDTAKACTTSAAAGANKLVGVATAPAANPSAIGTVRLNGIGTA